MKTEEIQGFVEIILRKRFHDVLEKQKIDSHSDRKLNFACPFCGDSDKKVGKKRGNLYLDTGAYKCFNDGCMAYMTVEEFVAKLSRQFSILLPDFALADDFKKLKSKRVDNQLVRFLTSDTNQLIRITDVVNRFSLKRLDQVPETSRSYTYIEGRDLTLIDDFGDSMYTDYSDNKIYIFNLDKRSGKILGFAIRDLDPDAERRYIIKSYTDVSLIFSQRNLPTNLVQDANYLNNYYNILNIDFSKPISMTEGQIDAMFIRNCIATTGVSKAKTLLTELGQKGSLRVIFDKDKAGKTQMMSLIKQGYSVFLWNKAMADLKKVNFNPHDFAKISDIKDINDLFSFMHKKDPTLDIEDFNFWIDDYFSDSIFDLIYL